MLALESSQRRRRQICVSTLASVLDGPRPGKGFSAPPSLKAAAAAGDIASAELPATICSGVSTASLLLASPAGVP